MTVAKRTKRPKPNAELMQLADSLLVNYKKPEDLIGENGLLKQLTKMLVERALEAEMADHLGHDKSDPVTNVTGNARNGHSAKTLKGEFGELPLDIPRDRQGAFEPQLIGKHQTRWTGFDDKIISLYPGGHFKFPHLWPGQTPPGGTTGMDGLLLGLVSLCKAVGGFFEPVAFAAEFDEDTAVQEAVQNGGGQRGVAKEFVPIFHDPV